MPTTRQSRRQFLIYSSLFGAAAAGVGLSGCGGNGGNGGNGGGGNGGGGSGGGRSGRSGETLFIAGFQWGPPTHFNLFGQSPGWPAGEGSMQLLYESLLRYNLLTGELEPGLGTELQTPDPYTFVVPLQEGAHWQDGEELTIDDVIYRFELSQRHSEVDDTFWNYVDRIEPGDGGLVIHLNQDDYNPGLVKNTLRNSFIVPKHLWEEVEAGGASLGEFENLEPVGSGPYQIANYDQQQVALARYDDYWGADAFGGLPVPEYINHPIFASNDDGDLAFEQGQIDVMQQFMPDIWETWEDKGLPTSTWSKEEPFHLPGSIPMLMVNTTKEGLDDPRVRRALAFAINTENIAELAMSRYSVPAMSSLLLPSGAEEKYFDQANVEEHGWRYDPDESKRILEEDIGAELGGDGVYVLPDGTRLGPWTVQTPNGWSDWQAALRIVADNAQQAGFDISTEFPEASVVTDAMNNGTFDLGLWFIAAVGPASPWQRFRDVLEDRDVPAPGERAFWNFGRFSADGVSELLDELAAADGDEEIKALTSELDQIFMENAPMIPLMYRPDQFYEFHEVNWENFPSEENDYAPPQFHGAGVSWLYQIKRV